MLAIHVHSLLPSISKHTVAALAMPAQRPALKRIRQKIGRIGITARVRFSLHFTWRGNDAQWPVRLEPAGSGKTG